MAKCNLKTALNAQKGRDYKLQKQKRLQKQAAKRKKSKAPNFEVEEKENVETRTNGKILALEVESEGWESDESEAAEATAPDTSRLCDSESDCDSDSSLEQVDVASHQSGQAEEAGEEEKQGKGEELDEEDSDVPLSDIDSLPSTEKADLLPHQRLTINKTAALLSAHKSITLPYSSLPFSNHQTLTTASPLHIPNINDDLNRELAFYKQCLDAAIDGRSLLEKEGVTFTRPNDYFAEMVKSDEHMGKIKQKMVDEAAGKKAAAEARRQRDLRKFGKQVQVAKLQERDKQKRETLDKINLLKKKRKNTDSSATHEEELFDVALDDAAKDERPSRDGRQGIDRGGPRNKRQKRDEKFGFGGKKRFAKSTDAASTADIKGFSAKKMKGKKGPQRLGKSRRAKL